MGFRTILGNDALRKQLAAALQQNKLSHCYLLCGPEGSGKHTLALWLAAAVQCTGMPVPCGTCPSCAKVQAGIHPDVITCVDLKHKQFGVDCAREICSDVYIRPNEGKRKVYILPQEMNLSAQNALLKVIEEPPSYAVFLFLSSNADQLLPTVRSRCQELRLSPLSDNLLYDALKQRFPEKSEADYQSAISISGGYLGQALTAMETAQLSDRTAQFSRCYSTQDSLGLLELLVHMEKLSRDDFIDEMEHWQLLLHQALRCTAKLPGSEEARAIAASHPAPELMAAIQLLRQTTDRAYSNVGIGHLCGALRSTLQL